MSLLRSHFAKATRGHSEATAGKASVATCQKIRMARQVSTGIVVMLLVVELFGVPQSLQQPNNVTT